MQLCVRLCVSNDTGINEDEKSRKDMGESLDQEVFVPQGVIVR